MLLSILGACHGAEISWQSEQVRAEQKPGYEVELDRLASTIEGDQKTVEQLLKRRVFIRLCMWEYVAPLFPAARVITDGGAQRVDLSVQVDLTPVSRRPVVRWRREALCRALAGQLAEHVRGSRGPSLTCSPFH